MKDKYYYYTFFYITNYGLISQTPLDFLVIYSHSRGFKLLLKVLSSAEHKRIYFD